MKRAIMMCMAVSSLLVAGYSGAQKKAKSEPKPQEPAVWAKEPNSFLGIKFGEPIPTLQECPRDGYGPDFERIKQLPSICLAGTPAVKEYFNIYNLPPLGFSYSVSMKLEQGVPVWFSLTTQGENFDQLVTAFLERYGPPSEQVAGSVKTRAGAEFSSRSYLWKGKRIEILLDERSERIDISGVMITDAELSKARLQRQQDMNKAGASKL
jgi:hypothetical protein